MWVKRSIWTHFEVLAFYQICRRCLSKTVSPSQCRHLYQLSTPSHQMCYNKVQTLAESYLFKTNITVDCLRFCCKVFGDSLCHLRSMYALIPKTAKASWNEWQVVKNGVCWCAYRVNITTKYLVKKKKKKDLILHLIWVVLTSLDWLDIIRPVCLNIFSQFAKTNKCHWGKGKKVKIRKCNNNNSTVRKLANNSSLVSFSFQAKLSVKSMRHKVKRSNK